MTNEQEGQAQSNRSNIINCFEKAPFLSTKHSSYFETYDKLLKQYVGKKIIFVEIGVFSGGSLFMWREYFGPQARVIGVEFNPEAVKWQEHGFEIHIGSQSDPKFWETFFKQVGSIDVLIDDGGHTYEQQIKTVHFSLPYINDGGCIIVEDTHTSYMKDFGYPSRYTFINWVKILIDQINSRSSLVADINKNYKDFIHSVEIFESIVAFKVDRSCCKKSYSVSNNKTDLKPEDYRFKDHEPHWIFIERLRKIKFIRKLLNSYAKRMSRLNLGKLKKYF